MTVASQVAEDHAVEIVLYASDTYRETLSLRPIPAQPWLMDVVIRTQLLTAKRPQEKRVKARCCVDRSNLVALHAGLGRFLADLPAHPGRTSEVRS